MILIDSFIAFSSNRKAACKWWVIRSRAAVDQHSAVGSPAAKTPDLLCSQKQQEAVQDKMSHSRGVWIVIQLSSEVLSSPDMRLVEHQCSGGGQSHCRPASFEPDGIAPKMKLTLTLSCASHLQTLPVQNNWVDPCRYVPCLPGTCHLSTCSCPPVLWPGVRQFGWDRINICLKCFSQLVKVLWSHRWQSSSGPKGTIGRLR